MTGIWRRDRVIAHWQLEARGLFPGAVTTPAARAPLLYFLRTDFSEKGGPIIFTHCGDNAPATGGPLTHYVDSSESLFFAQEESRDDS